MKSFLLRSPKVTMICAAFIMLLMLSHLAQAQDINVTSDHRVIQQSSVFLSWEKTSDSVGEVQKSAQLQDNELKKKQEIQLKKDFLLRKTIECPSHIPVSVKVLKRASIKANISKTVTVSAGGLSSALTEGELNSIDNLTVKGIIDARDFKTMRDNMPCLNVIDLSGTIIAPYTGIAGTDTTGITKSYMANEIPQYAFWNPVTHRVQQYSSINVPSTITSTGYCAFLGCASLTSFILPATVKTISELSFYKCSGLTSLSIPNSVKRIKAYAFSFTGLNSIAIPSSVDTLDFYAFTHNLNLTSADLSSKYIGFCAFDSCTALSSVKLNNTVKVIGPWAFEYCSSLTSISVPTNVDMIDSWAFQGCDNLTTATISADSIGTEAFEELPKLSKVEITSDVKSIGWWSFYGCNALTEIMIPGTINEIGFGAFGNCMSLTSVINNSYTTGFAYTFSNDSTLSSVTLKEGIGSIVQGTFENCSSLPSIFIPSTVTKIDYDAFSGCQNLTSIEIPTAVTSIGHYAFLNCWSIASLTIPSRVTSIGRQSFSGLGNLSYIKIPASLTSIDHYAFAGSSGDVSADSENIKYSSIDGSLYDKLKSTLMHCPTSKTGSFIVPSTVTFIDSTAFLFCDKLTSVTIPSSVNKIGSSAFFDCNSLTSIYVNAIIPIDLSRTNRVFDYVDKTSCTLYVPNGSKSAYQNAAYWKDFLNIEEIKDPTGIKEQELAAEIKINSYGQTVYVRFSEDHVNAKISVYDLTGRLIISKIAENLLNTIPIARSGIYTVRVQEGSKCIVKNVLVNE